VSQWSARGVVLVSCVTASMSAAGPRVVAGGPGCRRLPRLRNYVRCPDLGQRSLGFFLNLLYLTPKL
jgi:hypothetical protein